MARAELTKKLIASYGRDEEFRAVAEQIISEEEKKKNRLLASSLRKILENIGASGQSNGALSRLVPFPDEANDFIQRVEPTRNWQNILLSPENANLLKGLTKEFRQADRIRRHGLSVRSKMLFCGPPGVGKTLCAEVFAYELGLPFFHVRLDSLISSYLGETATNIRKTFEFARRQPCVLFFDEFDALARSRDEAGEHNELRRVVNSMLIFIEQIEPGGFLVAATNLDSHLDSAIWRRFDEVVWFDAPDTRMTKDYLMHAFRNFCLSFDPVKYTNQLRGYSYSDLERVCSQAIKASIIEGRKSIDSKYFCDAIRDLKRRKKHKKKVGSQKKK